jgi:hypothetical protein
MGKDCDFFSAAVCPLHTSGAKLYELQAFLALLRSPRVKGEPQGGWDLFRQGGQREMRSACLGAHLLFQTSVSN